MSSEPTFGIPSPPSTVLVSDQKCRSEGVCLSEVIDTHRLESISSLTTGDIIEFPNNKVLIPSIAPENAISNVSNVSISVATSKDDTEAPLLHHGGCSSNAETQSPGSHITPTKYLSANLSLQGDIKVENSKIVACLPSHIKEVACLPSHIKELTPSRAAIQTYPAALAKHTEVINDRQLFMDTLRKFHASLGSKIMIPKIGGSFLDLHLLYREVTVRGGLQEVIKNRIWKEIKRAFQFPRTATNASFVLRRYYTTLLHHYEQVYFLGAQGSLVPPPALATPSPQISTPLVVDSEAKFQDDSVPVKRKKRRRQIGQAEDVHPAACIGQSVTGAIDGKFDHGYLVTVRVGSENLRGVMYSVPQNSHPQFAMLPMFSHSLNSQAFLPGWNSQLRRRRRRKSQMPYKDPNAPKSNRSGYNFFFAEQRARLKLLHPDKDREISKMIGESWNKLTDDEKLPYQEQGQRDKERYRKEIVEYREKLQMQAENLDQTAAERHGNAMPAEERLPIVDDKVAGTSEHLALKAQPQEESDHEDNFHVSYQTYSGPSSEQYCNQTPSLEVPVSKVVYAHE